MVVVLVVLVLVQLKEKHKMVDLVVVVQKLLEELMWDLVII